MMFCFLTVILFIAILFNSMPISNFKNNLVTNSSHNKSPKPNALLSQSNSTLVTSDYQRLSKGFTENVGQLKTKAINFYLQSPSILIGFGQSFLEIFNQNSNIAFNVTFLKANSVFPIGSHLIFYSNYFIANQTFVNVPNYQSLWYYNLYPGIDLEYQLFTNSTLKYQFYVHPYANPI